MQNFEFINSGVQFFLLSSSFSALFFPLSLIKIEICFVYYVKIESSNDDGIGSDDNDKRIFSTDAKTNRRETVMKFSFHFVFFANSSLIFFTIICQYSLFV